MAERQRLCVASKCATSLRIQRPATDTYTSLVSRASTNALYAQLCLALFLTVCIALHPGIVLKWNEAGLSNYGVHLKTAIPYSLAFGGCAAFTFASARRVGGATRSRSFLRAILYAYVVLNVLTLVSTYGYTLNAPLKHVHMVVGIVVMVFEPLTSLWLYRLGGPSAGSRLWLIGEMVGLVLAGVDFAALLHILFLAQLFTGVSFGVLLVRAVRRFER